MTVTVKKVGGSVAVIIPKAMATEMELAEGTPLELSSSGGTITHSTIRTTRARLETLRSSSNRKPSSA